MNLAVPESIASVAEDMAVQPTKYSTIHVMIQAVSIEKKAMESRKREVPMITLDFTPREEEQIVSVARQTGLAPADYVKKLVKEHLPLVSVTTTPAIDEENIAAIALLESWLAAAPTDPNEIREADDDRDEFLQNLNRNRIESGERPLIP